ncbi:single-stranded DNA-binding protein [Enterococcus faecium]|nr:single-stranded DNA-binding protein [Enterococcus faecium]
MLNVHCIEGRLAESPILKKTESGTCYTRVLLISKRNFKTKRTWDKNPKSTKKPA